MLFFCLELSKLKQNCNMLARTDSAVEPIRKITTDFLNLRGVIQEYSKHVVKKEVNSFLFRNNFRI